MKGRNQVIGFRVSPKERRAFEILAEREDRTISELLREIVREGMQRRGLDHIGLIGTRSIDEIMGASSNGSTITDESLSDILEAEWARDAVQSALGRLDELERAVLEHKYGLIDGRKFTVKKIADYYDVTPQRVYQIARGALRKLKRDAALQELV